MAKLPTELKSRIASLSPKEKDRIIFKMARSSEEWSLALSYEYLNYPTKEQFSEDIQKYFIKSLDGLAIDKRSNRAVSQRIGRVQKRMDLFRKIMGDIAMYIDLHLFVVKETLSRFEGNLGRPGIALDSKLASLVRISYKLIGSLHPDYWADYKEEMDAILETLHRRSSHLSSIRKLPRKFEWTGAN